MPFSALTLKLVVLLHPREEQPISRFEVPECNEENDDRGQHMTPRSSVLRYQAVQDVSFSQASQHSCRLETFTPFGYWAERTGESTRVTEVGELQLEVTLVGRLGVRTRML